MLQVADSEELAAAMQPWVVTDGNLSHSESGNIELPGHLDTDDAASGFQGDPLEDLPSEKAEIAIDVPNGELKCKPHGPAIQLSNHNAIPCVRAFHLEAIDEIDVWPEFGQEIVDFAHIVLSIAVGVEDEIFGGVIECGNQRSPISAIGFMVDYAQEWKLLAEVFQYFPGIVFAPVVDNDHFEIVSHPANF